MRVLWECVNIDAYVTIDNFSSSDFFFVFFSNKATHKHNQREDEDGVQARTSNRTFDPGRDPGGGPRPADDSREGSMGRRDPGAADQVTRLSGCSLTRAAGAGSFERFSASFRDKLREKLARPDAAVPLREAGSLPSFSARRLFRRATAAAALRALRRARFFRASAAGSATMGGSGGLRWGCRVDGVEGTPHAPGPRRWWNFPSRRRW